jgi:ABC-2 type transport system permease protein
MPLFITLHDRLDIGQFMSGLLGLVLLLTTSLSLGFFISSFSKEPLIAALVIFISLFLLSLLEWGMRFISPHINWLGELALLYHCKDFLSGVISSRDILYYVLTTVFFLYLSVIRLNQEAIFKRSA